MWKTSRKYKGIEVNCELGQVIGPKGWFLGKVHRSGYVNLSVQPHGAKYYQKSISMHRLIWEEYHKRDIPTGMVIGHLNDIKTDNRIENLKLMTHSENNKAASKNRDYDAILETCKKAKAVRAICLDPPSSTEYKSIFQCSRALKVNPGQISMIVRGLNNCKRAKSKVDGLWYKFVRA